jgi:hypothetical protein
VLAQQAEIDRWLSGEMDAKELRPASESALREWPIDKRVNQTGVGDDDPTLFVESEFDGQHIKQRRGFLPALKAIRR